MKPSIPTLLLLLMSLVAFKAYPQRYDDLVQFSGVVVTADSLRPVPFANISVVKTGRGTTSDYWGFFSLVVHKNDLVSFSAVGYKSGLFRS